MVPYMTWWQRVIAWLLWKLETRNGFAGGFSDPMKGAEWVFLGCNEHNLYSVMLLRNYYYIKKHREWEKTHGQREDQ